MIFGAVRSTVCVGLLSSCANAKMVSSSLIPDPSSAVDVEVGADEVGS